MCTPTPIISSHHALHGSGVRPGSHVCAVPHCNEPVDTCYKHACPCCGVPKSSKLKVCPACALNGNGQLFCAMQPQPLGPHLTLPRLPHIHEGSLVRLHRKFETQHSALFQSLFDGVSVIEKVPLRPENTRSLMKEAEVHALVDRHPNVIRNYGICRRASGEISMVVEQLEGDLTERLLTMKRQPDFAADAWTPSLALYLVQVARGLRHMHQHGVIHRDICANNILTDGEVVKVSDFGLAKLASDRNATGLPYPLTTAPEVLRNMNDPAIWTTKADIWQFGLLICEVFSFGVNPLQEFNVSVPALLAGLDNRWLPPRPAACSDALWRIVLGCMEQDHRARPDMDAIVPQMEDLASGMAMPAAGAGSG